MTTAHYPWTEKMKAIPELFGIRLNEQPFYRVAKSDGAFEVRQYESLVMASLTLDSLNFEEFKTEAFPRLANYLFGDNRGQVTMSMTAPVFIENAGLQKWTMSVVLPSKYSMQNAPKPHDEAINVHVCESFEAAVVTFNGNNTWENIRKHERELTSWMAFKDKLKPEGKFIIAQYDAPFTIPFLKRNEILVKLVKMH